VYIMGTNDMQLSTGAISINMTNSSFFILTSS
jgi:hypothetical protein